MSAKEVILEKLPHSFNLLNRETFVFLALLLLSAAAWFAVTLRDTDKMELKIPIQLADIPEKKVILDPECDTLSIRVMDEGQVLLFNYSMEGAMEPIRISYPKYDKHNGEVVVTANELQRLVQQRLKQTTSIVSFKKEKQVFRYCDGTSKRVPVRLHLPEDASVNYDIKLSPDSITVYAHPSKLKKLSQVFVEDISLPDNANSSFTCKASLEKQDAVKYMVHEIEVTAKALRLVEKRIEIPITCINEPEGTKLRLFPSRLAVVFQVDMRMYKNVDASSFSAIVDFNDTHGNTSDNIEVKVVQKPNFIKNIKQERTSVGFLVEER